ncbi:MAG: D-alanyl-D-alanine carboxypeptidase/D-alanyl-D-alanine endopeptidase [Gemmatimonadota bacterium]
MNRTGRTLLLAWAMAGLMAPDGQAAQTEASSTVPAANPRAMSRDSLPGWLHPVADGALEKALWGVAVYDLDARRWVRLYNADRWFVPASNQKLVVSAVALERLGPGFSYLTSVYGTAPIEDGVLEGDLVIYGRGDPNLSGRYAPTMLSIFEWMADSLLDRGLTRVTGDLVADESHWDDEHTRGDWSTYDVLWWYAAPVGALGFNDNSIDFHVRPTAEVGEPPVIEGEPRSSYYRLENRAVTGPRGSATTFDLTRIPGTNHVVAYGSLPLEGPSWTEYFAVTDPARYTATVFREVLERKGIVFEGITRTISERSLSPVAVGDTLPLATHVSPALEKVVDAINNRSQNWHAEQLLKTLGRELAGEGSWEAGLAVERATLAALGVDTLDFELRDGSGLAPTNLATPRGLVTLLTRARSRPWGDLFAASLPVAAETGSLKRRYHGTVAEGRVRAKTGFIENVYALSGYLTTLDGHEHAFSVIVNGTGGGMDEEALQAIDGLVVSLVKEEAP